MLSVEWIVARYYVVLFSTIWDNSVLCHSVIHNCEHASEKDP